MQGSLGTLFSFVIWIITEKYKHPIMKFLCCLLLLLNRLVHAETIIWGSCIKLPEVVIWSVRQLKGLILVPKLVLVYCISCFPANHLGPDQLGKDLWYLTNVDTLFSVCPFSKWLNCRMKQYMHTHAITHVWWFGVGMRESQCLQLQEHWGWEKHAKVIVARPQHCCSYVFLTWITALVMALGLG